MKPQKEVKEMSIIEIQDRLRSFLENKNLTLENQYFLLKQVVNDIEQEIMEEEEAEDDTEEVDNLDDGLESDSEEVIEDNSEDNMVDDPNEIEEKPAPKKKPPVVKEVRIAPKKKAPSKIDPIDIDEDEF